jgi:N-methylhydantoinase B
VFCTAGAGGLGDPLTREPERVATDVRAGLVSVQAAREHYGVVVSERGEIDAGATEQAREQERDGVDRSDEFDFGPVPGKEQLAQRIADERREFDAWMAAESRA